MNDITVNGLKVKVVRKNIKNMYLRINKKGEPFVSAPVFLPDADVERFVLSKAEWLEGAVLKIQQRQDNTPLFEEGDVRTLLGKSYVLHIDTNRQRGYYFSGNDIVLCVGENSTPESRKKALAEVYRDALNEVLPILVQKCQEKSGLFANEWRIRDMKTRWGSCNTREKRIWISLWLVEKPIQCIEAVIYHELAHLKVKGHNKSFYSLLEKICPDYKNADKLLKKSRT